MARRGALLVVLGVVWHAGAVSVLRSAPACSVLVPRPRPRSSMLVAQEASEPAAPDAAPLESYDDAEARAFELYKAGEYERAVRMFELVWRSTLTRMPTLRYPVC